MEPEVDSIENGAERFQKGQVPSQKFLLRAEDA
jgi:hypothetical protein